MMSRAGNASKNVVWAVVILAALGAAGFIYIQRSANQAMLDRETELKVQGADAKLMLSRKLREAGGKFERVSILVEVSEDRRPPVGTVTLSGQVPTDADLVALKALVEANKPPMNVEWQVTVKMFTPVPKQPEAPEAAEEDKPDAPPGG